MNRFVQQGLRVRKAVKIAGISKSTFYYKSKGTKRGKTASSVTNFNGRLIDNSYVLEHIKEILSPEFIDYGYDRTTLALRDLGFVINRKKTYRLMAEHGLLQEQIKRTNGSKRSFVMYTSPPYIHPFATIEIDIKYVYLYGERRNFYLLTAIDTFTRIAVAWMLDNRMTKQHVAAMVQSIKDHELLNRYPDIKIIIRTDNGPQFIAALLAQTIEELQMKHEFILPGTPEQNGHIESFHSTLQRLVMSQYDLESYKETMEILRRFYDTYNNHRIMKAIAGYSPIRFLKAWETGKIGIKVKNGKQIFFRERQPSLNGAALSREDFIGVH